MGGMERREPNTYNEQGLSTQYIKKTETWGTEAQSDQNRDDNGIRPGRSEKRV